jgi:BirA family biotin operon repressor/biotin-[acetyl-CoA-carboxylase] ligase
MATFVSEPNLKAPLLLTGAKCFEFEGWTVHEFESVDSTNLVAANLPIWHAVRAETQTAGRGRFERVWVSDKGGLWLSAVVPKPPPIALDGLPLAAGLAVCKALRELGIEQLRMRWPNDVLVHDRKLAGLLVDQFAPDRLVIGIGVNVSNQPEVHDPKLQNLTTRFVELVRSTPLIAEITRMILAELRQFVLELSNAGFRGMLGLVNELWSGSRRVELALDSSVVRGVFGGVDSCGRLLLQNELGSALAYKPSQVRHLQEIDAFFTTNHCR